MSSSPSDRAPLFVPICSSCSTAAYPGDRFCTTCGHALPVPKVGRRLANRPLLAAGSAVLILAVVLVGARLVEPDRSAPHETASTGEAFGLSHGERSIGCSPPALDCTILTVPADHTQPHSGDTIEVRFGVHPASDDLDQLGILVVLTGGPGSSGIEDSQLYLDTFPRSVVDRYDLVFPEQRGVGRSAPAECAEAEARAPDWVGMALVDLQRALDETRAWVASCLEEAEIEPVELGLFATYQSAADLDAFLDSTGSGKVVLYGESYGTVLALIYASERPERVAALILDAPVDAAISAVPQTVDQAEAFSEVLDMVLDECAHDAICADDFATGDPAATWDALAAELREAPSEVQLPTGNGELAEVQFGLADLAAVATPLLYSEVDRGQLLRALAAASHGDLVPLVRLAGLLKGLDPETGAPLSPETGLAAFYAIACQDLDPQVDTMQELAGGVARLQAEGARLAEVAYNLLPCLAGFAGADPIRPEIDLPDVPTLILSATADPATPIGWARALARRAPNGHLIVTEGGSHGNYGWGIACTDDPVHDLLAFGDLPADTQTSCEGYVMDYYVPLPLAGPDEYADLLEALFGMEEALWNLPDYVLWDGTTRQLGCPSGGWMRMTYIDLSGVEFFELHDCRLLAEWPVTGTIRYDELATRMKLKVPGGELEYTMDEEGVPSLVGTVDGVEVDLSR